MEVFCKFQAMERNGDVLAELNSCNSPNCALITNSYNTDKYKMCKDDMVTPLFCSASDCLGKSMIMGSEHKSTESYLKSGENKINLFSPGRNYVSNDEFNMPVIESSVDSIQDCCDSPIWEKPPMLQSFSPQKVRKLDSQDSFINGSKLQISANKLEMSENKSLSKEKDLYDSKMNDSDIISKLLLDYEAETSSSSIEEVYCSPQKKSEELCSKHTLIETFDVDSNHNIKTSTDENAKKNISLPSSPDTPKLVEKGLKDDSNSNSPVKSDRVMPELIPTLICLDDEDSVNPETKIEQCEVIDVADSPEMPTLIPFTSEVDEAIRIKTECISEDEKVDDDMDSCDSSGEIRQPQVLLQRLTVNASNASEENAKDNISSVSVKSKGCKYIIEGPEIEEIEGVRFFQFRSKKDMEEFNRKLPKMEADEDMIIPTKTTDITQIKGWRTKYFAPESQFHNQLFKFDITKAEDSSQDSKISADQVDEAQNTNSNKKDHCSGDPKSESKKSLTSSKRDAEESDQNDGYGDSSSESEDEKRVKLKDIKDEGNKNPMSAFISEELDKYLLHSAVLNVSLLEQINPNIVPIAPDAPILSLGKLRKTDRSSLPPLLIFKRKREYFNTETVENSSSPKSPTGEPVITLGDSPASSSIITLESTEESEEDIPVAKLANPKGKAPAKKLNFKGSRKNLNSDLDQAAKRVVLRLTKEGNGVSKGYKVSEISCRKEKPESVSRASSPSSIESSLELSQDAIEIPPDGSLPIIKRTLFLEKNEPRLVNEFLNNLNMYGTRKDVAMLVQSNQSYFDEGPTLTAKICARAVSVLVSNKVYLEVKQKSKKKVLKTWQKYLPKKFDKQKMKMKFSKRKSCVQNLLDGTENTLTVERGKRSIRLPARYLDSAVLAASEWVSPVITIEDDTPSKNKRQPVEAADKSKYNNDSKSSASSSNSSSSSSSSDSSDENTGKAVIQVPQKRPISIKETPVNKKIIKASPARHSSKTSSKKSKLSKEFLSTSESSDEDTIDKSLINEATKNKLITVKEASPKTKKVEDSPSKLSPNVDCSKKSLPAEQISLEVKKSESPIPVKKRSTVSNKKVKTYLFPNCSCKHSSRTTLFNYETRQFICNFCSARLKQLSQPASVEAKKTEFSAVIKVESESDKDEKDEPLIRHNVELSSTSSSGGCVSESKISDSVNCTNIVHSEAPPNLSAALMHQNKIHNSDTSVNVNSMSVIDGSGQLSRPDQKVQSLNENVYASSNMLSNNVGNKYILLLQPVGNANNNVHVPLLSHQPNRTPVSGKKSKPPILIRKTSTGLVTRTMPSETSNYSSPSYQNSIPLSSYNTTASERLKKLSENASFPQISQSLGVVAQNTKDTTPQNVALINNSNANSKTSQVLAYKFGGNIWLCNSLVQPTESNPAATIVTPSVVQSKNTDGPIIASVQSVQPNGLTKCALINTEDALSHTSESTEVPKCTESAPHKLEAVINDHFNYHKKERQNRRKSPLAPMNYVDNETKSNVDEDIDVDIMTVDDTCNAFSEVKKKRDIDSSESDISDDECANIFTSSTNHLADVYSRKTLKERQRRLNIKSGFENLKATSKWFRSANTCIEILSMAQSVVNAHKKKEQMCMLAKKRLKIHNSMLMGKLVRQLEGIVPTNIRNINKMQIIRALALDQEKYKCKKSVLPLLSEGYKGLALNNSNTERNISNSDAPDIEIVEEKNQTVSPKKLLPPSPQPSITNVSSLEQNQSNSVLSMQADSSEEAMKNHDITPAGIENSATSEICLKSPEEADKSSSNSGKRKFEEMKKKVKDSLENKEKEEESSDSNTEELGSEGFNISGISDDDFDLEVSTSAEKNNSTPSPKRQKSDCLLGSTNISLADESVNKLPEKEYPGLIPLFHPKVLKENFTPHQSSGEAWNLKESSHRKNIFSIKSSSIPNVQEISCEDMQDDDDDVAIIGSRVASPDHRKSDDLASGKAENELAKAAETANKLFGPCTVQKVQLKSGKTVFAYKPEKSQPTSSTSVAKADSSERPTLQPNANGVRNLGDVLHSPKANKDSLNQKNQTVPEEIVLSDSDDENYCVNNSVLKASHDSQSCQKTNKSGAQQEKTVDEQMQIDESDSQDEQIRIESSNSRKANNSSL